MLVPTALGFTDNRDGHSLTIINPEWDVVLPIRNPYSRAVSFWNLRHNEKSLPLEHQQVTFKEFIKAFQTNEHHITFILHI
jgi:hypothetical protein